jgi:hypothetical protein
MKARHTTGKFSHLLLSIYPIYPSFEVPYVVWPVLVNGVLSSQNDYAVPTTIIRVFRSFYPVIINGKLKT